VDTLVEAAVAFLDKLCCWTHRLRDDDGAQRPLDKAALLAIHDNVGGGTAGLSRYWRDDVVGFGTQLGTIQKNLDSKFSTLVALDCAATSTILDDDVALISGNFGEGTATLGLDLLGLQELGLSEDGGIPDKMFRDADRRLDHTYAPSSKRPRRLQSTAAADSMPGTLGVGKRDTIKVLYPVPDDWPPIVPAAEIGLLREPLQAAVDAAAMAAAKAKGRGRGRSASTSRPKAKGVSQALVVPTPAAIDSGASTIRYPDIANGHF